MRQKGNTKQSGVRNSRCRSHPKTVPDNTPLPNFEICQMHITRSPKYFILFYLFHCSLEGAWKLSQVIYLRDVLTFSAAKKKQIHPKKIYIFKYLTFFTTKVAFHHPPEKDSISL